MMGINRYVLLWILCNVSLHYLSITYEDHIHIPGI